MYILRKWTLLDLTERNANHIIPLYCHLPVSCRSLDAGVVPSRAVRHRFIYLFILSYVIRAKTKP